jgi:hypothetical protein
MISGLEKPQCGQVKMDSNTAALMVVDEPRKKSIQDGFHETNTGAPFSAKR